MDNISDKVRAFENCKAYVKPGDKYLHSLSGMVAEETVKEILFDCGDIIVSRQIQEIPFEIYVSPERVWNNIKDDPIIKLRMLGL